MAQERLVGPSETGNLEDELGPDSMRLGQRQRGAEPAFCAAAARTSGVFVVASKEVINSEERL